MVGQAIMEKKYEFLMKQSIITVHKLIKSGFIGKIISLS